MRGAHGEVLQGDNLAHLEALSREPEVSGHVALVYLDPPFGTGRDFGAYDDRWSGGRKGLLDHLVPRLAVLHRLLADDGSILVHLDHRVAHLVALHLDELFGPGEREPGGSRAKGFRNEIIWSYGLGGSSPRSYPRKHDTILWYSKGEEWFFDPPRIPARSARMRGLSKKQPDVWSGPPALDETTNDARTDVWEVASINNMAQERSGYPTQKPLALLSPLVTAHSRPGELVIDPYCGSGTTVVAAVSNGRRAIGIDASPEAVATTHSRLRPLP